MTLTTPRTERSVYLGDGWARTPLGLYLPPREEQPPRYRRPVAVDLFCGAGGASVGLHQAGFHVAGAVEFDVHAAATYLINLGSPNVRIHYGSAEVEDRFARHLEKEMKPKKGAKLATPLVAGSGWISHYGCEPDAHGGHHEGVGYDGKHSEYLEEINERPRHADGCEDFWLADIRELSGRQILDALELEVGELDLVWGSPPCQGFSMAGRRNVHDPRNSLVFEWARLIVEMQPRSLAMENVPGMVSMVTPEGVPVVDELCRYLESGGINTASSIKNALEASAGVGIAQRGRAPSTPVKRPRSKPKGSRAEQTELFAGVGS